MIGDKGYWNKGFEHEGDDRATVELTMQLTKERVPLVDSGMLAFTM